MRALIAALLCLSLPVCAQPAEKLYTSAAEVQAAMVKAKAEHKSDTVNTVEPLALVAGYPVQLEYRTGTTPASIHPVQDEFIEVVDGACTFVTGGTLENAGTPAATITGGASRRIAKGDYVLVPANTPHKYTEVQGLVIIALHMP